MGKTITAEYYRVEVRLRPANGKNITEVFSGGADDVIESDEYLKARVERFLTMKISQGMQPPIQIFEVSVYNPQNYCLRKQICGWIMEKGRFIS